MNPKPVLILDIGGTFIKCSDGREIPVPSDGTREEIAAAFQEATRGDYAQIRIAIPGPFNYREGIFEMKHKYAAVYGENFRDLAAVPASCPISYVHDVVGAFMNELEADESLRSGVVALVTIGTGLGFAYAVDGQIRVQADGSPEGSLWDLPYGEGILEDYVSKRAIVRNYGKDLTVKEIAMKAYAGDAVALAAFSTAGRQLGEGARPVLERYGVRKVVFAGQISKSFSLMEDVVRQAFGPGIETAVSVFLRK